MTALSDDAPLPSVSYGDALRVWTRVALQSFGGPAGQIAVMHRILVDEKRWVSEGRFLHALNYCMLLPGPEAQQLATYIGWLLHGTRGGVTAGVLFVLPGFLAILALSVLYALYRDAAAVAALFFGLKAAVLAVVAEAAVRIGRRVLGDRLAVGIATAAFLALFVFEVPFPIIIAAAALIGYARQRWARAPVAAAQAPAPRRGPAAGRTFGVAAICLGLWVVPPLALGLLLGRGHVFVEESLFFSKAAIVTFGGAYSVLAYIAQQAVDRYGWLRPGEMLDGLGMAETTPGPLIMVVQFVGFMGAFRDPGALAPVLAGVLGSVLTTWVTFVPCFLWIFLGAPYIEALRGNPRLGAALSSITAAVVGVIANLAIWFALHTLFGVVEERRVGPLRLLWPDPASLDPSVLLLAGGAAVALLRYKVGMLRVLAASAAAGALIHLATRGM